MYTRCPECQTVFRITAAQLKARAGQVRCGRCQHVFAADAHLVERPAKPAARNVAPKKRAPRKSTKPEKSAAGNTQSPDTAPATAPAVAAVDDHLDPLPEPLWLVPRSRTRTRYWIAGTSLLLLLLFLQSLFFYGRDVVRLAPFLDSTFHTVCDLLPCRKPAFDIRRLDLVESQVTPHPRYDKALRVRATLVNRADIVQSYPLLEVSLLDTQGQLLARRAYRPEEYLQKSPSAPAGLPPQLAVTVEIDITSPGPLASGFEVQILPPPD
ncbi:MAG: DUF3426 domain-containing protein [Gammaproteobacteria bacterium]|nr:DUF3426 domain-containing protein [Gammaproteobacteria bacterium]